MRKLDESESPVVPKAKLVARVTVPLLLPPRDVVFMVHITSGTDSAVWVGQKRYREFEELNTALLKTSLSRPDFVPPPMPRRFASTPVRAHGLSKFCNDLMRHPAALELPEVANFFFARPSYSWSGSLVSAVLRKEVDIDNSTTDRSPPRGQPANSAPGQIGAEHRFPAAGDQALTAALNQALTVALNAASAAAHAAAARHTLRVSAEVPTHDLRSSATSSRLTSLDISPVPLPKTLPAALALRRARSADCVNVRASRSRRLHRSRSTGVSCNGRSRRLRYVRGSGCVCTEENTEVPQKAE